MPKAKRRKIEVPTDTQPQFELGDTAEDIEKEAERGEGENRKRGTERGWREREEGREPGKRREKSANRHGY